MVITSNQSAMGVPVLNTLEELRVLWSERRLSEAWAIYAALEGNTEAEVHLLGAYVAAALDNRHEAVYASKRALQCAPKGELLAKIRFRYGADLLRLLQPEAAIEQFRAWVENQLEHPRLVPVMGGHVWRLLGLAYRLAGRSEDALHAFAQSCNLFRSEGIKEELCKALLNLAWIACLFGDAVQARLALEEARPLATNPYTRWHHRIGEAYLESISDNCGLALAICAEIQQQAVAGVPLEVQSHACWVAGHVELRAGRLDEDERLAHQGLSLGVRAKEQDTRCLYDNADLLREVEQRRHIKGVSA